MHSSPITTLTHGQVIAALLEVGRRAAHETTARHPVDVAYAMTFAIESAGETLAVLADMGFLAVAA